MQEINWHAETVETCYKKLKVSPQGLSSSESKKRLLEHGKNEFHINNNKNILKKWANQFNNVLIYILLIAATITGLLQHWVDTSVILTVVLLNALIGYAQEGKAEKAIEALRKMLSPKANVIRDGKRIQIDARELVPGDIVFLHSGNKVPADLRLVKTNNLQIDESILTGESFSSEKNTRPSPAKALLTKRESMAYSGTLVTYGMGIGVVVATGSDTEVGRISAMLKRHTQFSTPLLRQLTSFGRTLAIIILTVSLLIFLFGIFIRAYPIEEMFMMAVAIAVSVIPEGLPAIITIALAVGVTRMASRNAIIRRLASVETLSSVTVICTDKTGTLTKNELTVQKIITTQNQYDVTGSGYNDDGTIVLKDNQISIEKDPDLSMLIKAGILCNDAELSKTDDMWHLAGNPIDGALLALGFKANLNYKNELNQYRCSDVIPFDSKHKFMASLHHNHEGHSYVFVKGAPEKILSMCSEQLQDGNHHPLDKSYWDSQIEALAKESMRILALAFRKTQGTQSSLQFKDVKKDLTLIGIVGIIDPPREEARDAILKCQRAGMRVKMVTGDHRLTAQAIAKQVGILSENVLTGESIDGMSDAKLAEVVEDTDVFARTIPEHKIRLIKALRARNHIVAMTGDGVNDAPALKNADIGIAMGIKGTDVAKEASEIVLADDNFASIKHAVEEGRNVYNNIKKTLLFILPNDGGEGLVIFFAILFGYTLPITPLQILWVNMVTAVTLALALAFEPPEKKLMLQKPRNPNERLLSKFLLWRIGFVSFLFLCSMFSLFVYATRQGATIELARTLVVNVLVLMEATYLINCRRIYDTVLSKDGLFGSKPVLIAIFLVLLLQLGFTYLPFMQYLFKTQPISVLQWSMIFIIVVFTFLVVEFEKMVVRYTMGLRKK